MRTAFIKKLVEEATKDERIWLITPDLGYGVLESFSNAFPERFLNVGIAEQNAIGIASGLALNGKIPYVYSIIPFVTSRCYEQIKIDCAYMHTNVRIVGVGAGYSYGPAGATHHAIEDIAIMRALPNMSIFAPGCVNEAEYIASYSVQHKGPIYIRLAKKGEPKYDYQPEFGKFSVLRQGSDFVVIATSNMLVDAVELVEKYVEQGRDPMLVSAHTLKPFDKQKILNFVANKIPIISLEEHSIIGGLSSAISEIIATNGQFVPFLPIAIPDIFSHFIGDEKYIKEKMGLTNLYRKINNFLHY